MHIKSPNPLLLLLTVIFTLLFQHQVAADTGEIFAEQTKQLQFISGEMRQKVLPMLSLIREMEKQQPVNEIELVKVHKTTAAVYEADNADATVRFTANMHDEYPIKDQRDQWFQITLKDGRTGWIHEDDVQIITVSDLTGLSGTQPQQREMLELMAGYMKDIHIRHNEASAILDSLQQMYNGLPLAEKQSFYTTYETALKSGDQIRKYYGYAARFYQPYAIRIAALESAAAGPTGRRTFAGNAGLNLGHSEYKFDKMETSTSRNINLGGSLPLNDRSRLSFGFNNRKEVLITPFSTMDMHVGYSNRFNNGLNLDSRLTFNKYNDEKTDRNNFGQIGAQLNATYPMSPTNQLFGYYQLLNKSYSEDGGNNYTSNQFNVGSKMKRSPTSDITANLRGIIQSSDISYLSFNQWTPRVRYVKQHPNNRSFGAIADVDMISYDEEAKNNNYVRENIQLRWTAREKAASQAKQVKFIAKQFSNNELFNYLKLGGDMRWQQGTRGFGASSATTLYGLVTYFPNENAPQSDYLDLRADRMTTAESWFFNVNGYTRLWSDASASRNVDHIINLYSKIGVVMPETNLGPIVFSKLRFGPILGAHILFNKDERFIKNDGNSIRIGMGFQSYFSIKRVTGHISYTAERSIVYGNAVEVDVNTGQVDYGRLVKRKPTTIQWKLGARMPVSRDLDFQVDMSYFNIELDVDPEASINPVENRSKFSLLGGLAWRFDFLQIYDNITGQFTSEEGR